MLSFWGKWSDRPPRESPPLTGTHEVVGTYQATSTASVDALWRKVVDLADVSWHPLISKTNVPYGLIPKPGLIYRAVSRLFPIAINIFVEKVLPCELLSVRILALPGVEERVTYRVESTVYGTRVSYSVTLKGWLSPIVWSIIKPYAAKVASELVQAAEQEVELNDHPRHRRDRRSRRQPYPDIFGLFALMLGTGEVFYVLLHSAFWG